jgi:hypothetical protein
VRRQRLAAGLILAAVLIGGNLIYALFIRTALEEFHNVDTARLPELDYCEVKNNPRLYNGKIIRIRAPLGQYMHGVFFADPGCANKYYEELLDHGRTALAFFEPKRTELWKSSTEILKARQSRNAVPVIAVGRFEWKHPKGTSDAIEDRTSFHFELYSIQPAP